MSVITAHWWRGGGFRVHRSGREKGRAGVTERQRERDREMENKITGRKKREQVLKRPSNEGPREIARN